MRVPSQRQTRQKSTRTTPSSTQTSKSGSTSASKPASTTRPSTKGATPSSVKTETILKSESKKVVDAFEELRARDGSPAKPSSSKRARAEDVIAVWNQVNAGALTSHPAGYHAKVNRLVESPFAFFRGMAPLFFRDLEGVDRTAPRVMINGDVHPENFGVTRAKDGSLMFGLNDFDEGTEAPFTFDVRRGAVGFELLGRARDLSEGAREKLVRAFVDGYSDALEDAVRKDAVPTLKDGASPKVLAPLFDDAKTRSANAIIQKYVDGATSKFTRSARLTDVAPDVAAKIAYAFQHAKSHENARLLPENIVVKDVVERLGSGTASLAKRRYWVLVEGSNKDGTNDRVFEVKQSGESAVNRAIPVGPTALRIAEGQRVALAEHAQSNSGVPHGHTRIEKKSFLVRERIPEETSQDVWGANADDLVDYARACGAALASAHALSSSGKPRGAAGVMAARIRDSFSESSLKSEMATFASDMADTVESDHKQFSAAAKKHAMVDAS